MFPLLLGGSKKPKPAQWVKLGNLLFTATNIITKSAAQAFSNHKITLPRFPNPGESRQNLHMSHQLEISSTA